MSEAMTNHEAKIALSRIRDWANAKIQSGSEPPWAWYQYMKLLEVTDTILEAMEGIKLVNASAVKKVNMPL
jgi:hypothetical protein